MTRSTIPVLSFIVLAFIGCGSSEGEPCDASAQPAVTVVLRDASTRAQICVEGAVVVRDGAFAEELALGGDVTLSDGSKACAYKGARERAGTYTITASLAGYTTATTAVTASKGTCHIAAPLAVIDVAHE